MVVSDLTYVRVQQSWHYICVLIDLYNREINGYSSGPHKSAELVRRAFATVPYNLNRLELFHTDRGSEFKNKLIDQALETFGIERSLSEKGTPYDNAVAESTFKTIKTEFIRGRVFPCPSYTKEQHFECLFGEDQKRTRHVLLKGRLYDLFLTEFEIMFMGGYKTQYDFILNAVTTRHYYTHYDETKMDKIFTKDELEESIYWLKTVLEYH